jgi:hypothetical protein
MLRWPSSLAAMWTGRPPVTASVVNSLLVSAVGVCGQFRVAIEQRGIVDDAFATGVGSGVAIL